MNAYYNTKNIFTIIHFPLISFPKYKLLNVITLPVRIHENTFAFIETETPLIAINTEGRTRITLSERELHKCKEIDTEHFCAQNFPIHRINNNNHICETEIYLENNEQYKTCKIKYITLTHTLWIDLSNSQTWLYSSPTKQIVTILCKDHGEIKEMIENTGKITLEKNCKLITPEIIIKAPKKLHGTEIDSYLPEFNISLLSEKSKTEQEKSIQQKVEIKNINQNSSELNNFKSKLQETTNDLDNIEKTYFQSKQFIYPMATSEITVLLVIIAITTAIIYILKKKKWSKPKKRVTLELDTENNYHLPKHNLKRTCSTRF